MENFHVAVLFHNLYAGGAERLCLVLIKIRGQRQSKIPKEGKFRTMFISLLQSSILRMSYRNPEFLR